ncbi:alpha/beta hydrolase [uncultured Cyclobacterium sp.]|uniref:alpha/beta hydrolase n=1 Tax=uncultured Cyclobacterium sp. TaxID=453820 RepID=UPI0030EC0995
MDLYPENIPNSKAYAMQEEVIEDNGRIAWLKNVSKPTLTSYHPSEKIATGAAVIICPGGGYSGESYLREGTLIAETFVKKGIAAFILKYRLPSDSIMIDKAIGPLQDAQQAIKTVRQNASAWNIDPSKIGIMGFSAGGHLASTAGTHFDKSYIPNKEQISLRPDFMVLIYPVISMTDEIGHLGSRQNLLGKSASEKQKQLFSNELQVGPNTPPTWITHTGDDNVVPVENSIRFYQALIKNEVPSEMHLYPKGNHGFVLSLPTEEWMQPLFDWMRNSGISL